MTQRDDSKLVSPLSSCCEVCDGSINEVILFPKMPITGIYSRHGQDPNFLSFDQSLMLCGSCGHAQLRNKIDGDYLYGQSYGFRTSTSATASKGSVFFASYLDRLFSGHRFKRVLEFGCNDAVLIKLLAGKADRILGVDPIWIGCEPELEEKNIRIRGGTVESCNVVEELEGTPDLIVSQHTMEHISRPRVLLEKLLNISDEKTVLVFEFPCFDPLIEQLRFDQVFHQHLQYFSVQSFLKLLEILGAQLIDYTFNYTYWGAVLFAFKKKIGTSAQSRKTMEIVSRPKKPEEIQARYMLFRNQMETTRAALESEDASKLFGYGGALMLPILDYHLSGATSRLQAVFDDDQKKDGLGYVNLPVRIVWPSDKSLSDSTILLTAMDNRRPILRNLIAKAPKRIINPLLYI